MFVLLGELSCERSIERLRFLISRKMPDHFPNSHENRKMKDASQNNKYARYT